MLVVLEEKILKENLKAIKKEFNIDFIIANGENVSHGFGLTLESAKKELFQVELI